MTGTDNKAICDSTHALLWEYACGTLDGSVNLLIESLLEVKPQTRQIMNQFETIGGSMIESLCPPEKMHEDSLTKVLAAMNCTKSTAARAEESTYADCEATCSETEKLPATLRHYMNICNVALRWRKMGKGLVYCKLPVQDEKHAIVIIKAQPGARIPQHKHNGTEMTLVLSGAFSDENGKYHRGDVLIEKPDSCHQPVVSGTDQCLCLVISDAPLEFTGRLTKLLNFLRV